MINYQRIKKLKDQHQVETDKLQSELHLTRTLQERTAQVLEGTLHEVRRFSSEISAHAEQLNRILSPASGGASQTTDLANTIFYTSGMLSARLAFADLELNPASVENQIRTNAGIYKKCEKARHILSLKARAKNVAIRFQGSSFFSADLLQAFELVPFVLLENAIKYSPRSEEVLVGFVEQGADSLTVNISSIGPQAQEDEIPHLIDRGFRAKGAINSHNSGEGLGLFLVDFLCGLHDVGLQIASNPRVKYSLEGVPHSEFCVTLHFEH
jgi:signal transduction histidine kinase